MNEHCHAICRAMVTSCSLTRLDSSCARSSVIRRRFAANDIAIVNKAKRNVYGIAHSITHGAHAGHLLIKLEELFVCLSSSTSCHVSNDVLVAGTDIVVQIHEAL